MELDKIDRNLKIETIVTEADVVFRDVRDTPARIFGLHQPETPGPYCRMPEQIAEQFGPAVAELATFTSGGRCRFLTDSEYVAIRVDQRIHRKIISSHMTFLGAAGFDCYIRENGKYIFCGSMIPPTYRKDGYETIIRFPDRRMRDVTLNFPLYDRVQGLEVGIQADALLQSPPEYTIQKPVLFYGNSITQGGCASRPGACYAALLSRRLDFDYRNFGFSGCGLGEAKMAHYLAEFDASAFVMDYDYNAPNVQHLEQTHQLFFQIIREAHPELPILIMPSNHFYNWERNIKISQERRKVIRRTYEEAVASGDRHVYWIDAQDIFRDFGGNECTVDNCHPTDLGFWCIANAMEPILKEMLY